MVTVENRDNFYSLAYDASNKQSGQRPWGIDASECFTHDGPMTPQEALILARANYSVEPRPVYADFGAPVNAAGKRAILADGFQAMVRTDTKQCLGINGERYVGISNESWLAVLPPGTKIDALAVLDNGSKVYFQALLSTVMIGKKKDGISQYLTGLNSFDGSSGASYGETMTRIVCANTYALARREMAKAIAAKIRGNANVKHTRNADNRLDAFAAELAEIKAEHDAQASLFDRLARKQVTPAIFTGMLDATFPVKVSKSEDSTTGQTRTMNVRNRITEIFETHEYNAPADGTLWDAWNAVTAYSSHEAGVRGVTGVDAQVSRWLRNTIEGSDTSDKALAFLTAQLS